MSIKSPDPTNPNQPAPAVANAQIPAVVKLGFKDLKPQWDKLNARRFETLQTDVLKISPPRAKLDPIAMSALRTLRTELKGQAAASREEMERNLRNTITNKGIASKVKKVTDRLNRRHMTDGRRWVLATTYMYLLSELFRSEPDDEVLKRLMKDDLGVAERLMLDLEAQGGPVEKFATRIVALVMEQNRVDVEENKVILEIVSQQVRAAI